MSKHEAEMVKETVADNIYLYTFSDPAEIDDSSIVVVVQEGNALIIDPSYPEYSRRLKDDLLQQNIKPEVVVISHFHPDHVAGCTVFDDCEIYASEFYESNFGNCSLWAPEYQYIRPKYLIQDGDHMPFGQFNLEFVHAPGHCKCALITMITEKIIHINDLFMISRDGSTCFPLVADGGTFPEHIKSLELIRELNPDILLVPHGGMLTDKSTFDQMIDERVFYLRKLYDSKGQLPLEQCLKKDPNSYTHLELHGYNLMRLM